MTENGSSGRVASVQRLGQSALSSIFRYVSVCDQSGSVRWVPFKNCTIWYSFEYSAKLVIKSPIHCWCVSNITAERLSRWSRLENVGNSGMSAQFGHWHSVLEFPLWAGQCRNSANSHFARNILSNHRTYEFSCGFCHISSTQLCTCTCSPQPWVDFLN